MTPDSSTDLPNEICNTGKIVVKKRIPKIEKGDSIQLSDHALRSANGKMLQRKKKGRLYSLGGNEPMKKPRGRLDRLKTVGTFDLGTEMSVLSEVARNLNEKIISGDIDTAGVGNSSGSGVNRRLSTIPAVSSNDLHGLSTPKCGRREIQESNSSHSSHSSKRNVSKVDGSRTIVYFDQHSSDLNNRKHKFNSSNLSHTKMQHSADDCLDKAKPIPNNQKSRSLSSSSCLTKNSDRERNCVNHHQRTFNSNRVNTNKSAAAADANMVFISIKDSNKIPSIDSPDDQVEKEAKVDTLTDSNKIELDMRSAEDINKIDDEITFKNRPKKPMLRKSQRIVRTDSEIFDENVVGRNEIVLQTNLDIQIHKEPDYYSETASTTHGSRIASSDIEDNICSPKDLQKSTDDSSRNLSTDELDTVFSDTTDLERLDREYRELARSNLQREYKSDGDSLDEVGKKRNEFLKWKNQSFENDFELYNDNGNTNSEAVCSPDGPVTSTTNTSENGSAKCTDENKLPRRSYEKHSHSRAVSPKESDNSTLTSPIRAPSACTEKSSTNSIDNSNARPTKLDVAQNPPAKEGTITSLFEKRFGKIKKINKLLKCKRFSASALYDKKKTADIELKNVPQKVEKPSKAKSCSPAKTNDSKNSIHSSKLSLFHPKAGKSSIFSIRKSPMFSNASHSNSELNTTTSGRTRLTELSKSNFEINNFKSSPSRFSTKRSMKDSKNNSTACLYKEQKHSPLSEEFYNKTGSVRLSAMELYEKFCSEDFGGLYKNENGKNADETSCGGYKNWHEYRLGHKGLGAVKKYARGKNARLLRQKSEPKFSFRDGSESRGDIPYFPEEEYEDIYEENANDEFEGEEESELEEEYEDEEGDYYEDECEEEEQTEDEGEEEEDEDEELNEQDKIKNQEDEVQQTPTCTMSEVDGEEDIIDEEYEAKAYHSEIEDRGDIDLNIGADSDVDEIFLMPAPKPSNYDQYGFENKQFTLEQSLLNRSNGIECNLNELSETCDDGDYLYSGAQDSREIVSFGSDEILTIYKICSKDDILNMKDEKIHKTVSAQECLNTASIALERAVNEYIKNAPSDIPVEVEPSIYKTDVIARSESFELLSSSSGTIRSGSTLTEYAFDTVRNLNLDSCSTSKLSLSLKSEIFDDFTLTPDEPKVVLNCEFEDFTLTPDGSFSEATSDANQFATNDETLNQKFKTDSVDSEDATRKDESITSNEVMMIVDKFLANEKLLYEQRSVIQNESVYPSTSTADTQQLTVAELPSSQNQDSDSAVDLNRNRSFSSSDTEEKFSIVDLDDESTKNAVSDFTSEITKEFDLLFCRAQLENDENLVVETEEAPSNDSTLPTGPVTRIPSRYSMQRLEPYFIAETEKAIALQSLSHSPSTQNEYCKVLDVHDGSFIHKRVISKLKKNRSQSLGNLSNKTRCFPL